MGEPKTIKLAKGRVVSISRRLHRGTGCISGSAFIVASNAAGTITCEIQLDALDAARFPEEILAGDETPIEVEISIQKKD